MSLTIGRKRRLPVSGRKTHKVRPMLYPTQAKVFWKKKEETHKLFDFLYKDLPVYPNDDSGWIDALGGLLPELLGEEAFANRMKKKRRKRRKIKIY